MPTKEGTATTPPRVQRVGDLHMNPLAALQVIDPTREIGAERILQIGDFGFWPSGNTNTKSGQKHLRMVDT